MGSRFRRHLDERGLKVIEGVFGYVWPRLGKISADQPDYEAFRLAVLDEIISLAEQGITDPIELRAAALSFFAGQEPGSEERRFGS